MHFYSNGKLLLTGEYLVLDGAKALAIPTKFGQDLLVEKIEEPQIIWGSFDLNGNCWFEAVFELPKLRLISATFESDKEENAEIIAETLLEILLEAKKMNPNFLSIDRSKTNCYTCLFQSGFSRKFVFCFLKSKTKFERRHC